MPLLLTSVTGQQTGREMGKHSHLANPMVSQREPC
jgi:hypothetical protein